MDGVSVCPAPGGPGGAATACAGIASNSDPDSLLVIGPSTSRCIVTDALQYHLNDSRLAEAHVTFDNDKEVEDFVEESRWSEKLGKIKNSLHELSVKAACFIHSMPPRRRGATIKDKATRLSLALLLRLVSLVTLMVQSSLPYVLVSSWPDGEEMDIRKLQDFSENAPHMTCFVAGGICYQVLSNSRAAIEHDNLDDVLSFVSTRLTSVRVASNPNAVGARASTQTEDENLLRPQVRQPLKLSQNDAASTRQLENQSAIGGMKDPRKSIRMIPGHRMIGKDVAKILENFLADYPHVHTAIHRSIGDHSKKCTGPSTQDVQAARKLIESYFKIRDSGKQGKTQLNQELYEAWTTSAQDPDKHVPSWLKLGTPLGMVHCPELAGIFPPSTRTLSPEERRPLQYADEEFLNYSSIEDSEYGEEVLGDLVNSRFVEVFDDYQTACRHIAADDLIYSKLALITTTKDGIVKHRLILDLRVSGCNDAATKVERIILPSAWDVINNAMRVVARGGDSSNISFFVCDFRDAF